jgi:UDP-N-acetylglucosamine 2-epimerase
MNHGYQVFAVVGARPKFVKIAAICEAIREYNHGCKRLIEHVLVRTGQQSDATMSDLFFNDLSLQF